MKKIYILLFVALVGLTSGCDKSEVCTAIVEKAAYELALDNFNKDDSEANCALLKAAAIKLSQKFESCETARTNNAELVISAKENSTRGCIK